MNEYLPTTPFDIYELNLLHLVVKHGSFTKAGEFAGLTQSAITRQIQGMESRLGLDLLERTTRSVKPTPAGEYLLQEASKILKTVEDSIQTLREQFGDAPKQVRVGVSRSISHAYLPGFFFSSQRNLPHVSTEVSHESSGEILRRLEAGELDLGVMCPPERLPKGLKITHRFRDDFTLIVPTTLETPSQVVKSWTAPWKLWAQQQRWLLIQDNSRTGQRMREWLSAQQLKIEPAMQMDNFDLVINLVLLGMGVGLVPQRALAPYANKKTLRRIPLAKKFSRELVVLMRRQQKPPEHLTQFVENILF
jgi:DNA-binding transcriptional LysR family regulator